MSDSEAIPEEVSTANDSEMDETEHETTNAANDTANDSLNDSENADGDDAEVVTMTLNDVLEMEDQLVEDTAAVLGAANDKVCSYTEGYMKRQALYSCLTCIPEAKEDPDKAGGVCLGCCYHCHDGHELIELYTKRNFRCDCGNSKFAKENKCILLEYKEELNESNAYNQNFSGAYCVCHRPYPDPDDPIPDEMIQCIICEDWYHSRHLGVEVPSDNFSEMTCEQCITKHDFLLYYDGLTVNKVTKTTEEADVDPTGEQAEDVAEDSECKKPKEKSPKCSAKFWLEPTWRKQLCTCDDCLKMYESQDVAFLLDKEDPVHIYEERSKAKAKALVEEQSEQMIQSLPRVQAMEVVMGYNELKENLGEYLKKFAENKKVVREEDILEFFEGMKARKKQRSEVPYHCR